MTDIELIKYTDDLTALAYVAGFLGIVIIAIFFILFLKIFQKISLQRFRSTTQGFPELLNYGSLVDDGIILCKNGALMAAWSYTAPDITSAPATDRNLLSDRINQLLTPLDNGFMIHVDAVRTPVPTYFNKHNCSFPDRVSEALDEVRRQAFEQKNIMYDSSFVITLTYYPPKMNAKKLAEAMFSGGEKVKNQAERALSTIDDFKERIHNFERSLNDMFDSVHRLQAYEVENEDGTKTIFDSFLAWLQFCISGEFQPVKLPATPIYLDAVLGGLPFRSGVVPRIGKKYIKVISLDDLPAETSPGIFTILTELGCEYRWSSRFIFIERYEANAIFNRLRAKWKQKERGFFSQLFNLPGKVNLAAVKKVEEADIVVSVLTEGEIAFGYYTSAIVLIAEDQDLLQKQVDQVLSAVRAQLGLIARVEDLNAVEAYLGTLPGHGAENVRRPLISTLNFADLIPVSTPFLGNPNAPCPFYEENAPALMKCITGRTLNTPFYLNLHVDDLGHTLIFGPPGAGKSTLLVALEAQFLRYKDMQIFAFDKGMSMFTLCKAVGGLHFKPGADDSDLAFCPLALIDKYEEISWAADWIESILSLNVREDQITPELRIEINLALQRMFESKQRDPAYDMSLSTFRVTVQNELVRNVLSSYIVESRGAVGKLFDSKEDGLKFSKFTVFEMEDLLKLSSKYCVPALTYIFKVVSKSLHGQPSVIVLDEAWVVLQDPTFRKQLKEWLKVLRKANCIVIIATQSLSDAVESGILPDLIESTATKIFLPNSNAKQEKTRELYAKFGLNTPQIDAIAIGQRKRDYFYFNNRGQYRSFQLGLSKFELAFFGVSDKEQLQQIQAFIDKDSEHWVDHYLKFKGLKFPGV